MLIPTVSYLRVVDCEHDTVKQNEGYRKDYRQSMKKVRMSSYKLLNKTDLPKITN